MTSHIHLKKIENTNSTISWLDDSIVHIVWKKATDISIEDIDELMISFDKLTGGKPVKVVTEIEEFVNINAEARVHAANITPHVICIAYVIKSLAQRIALRFYLKLRRQENPTKVFLNSSDAFEWVRGY